MVDLSRTLVLNIDIQNAFGENAASEKLRALRPTERAEVEAAVALSEAVCAAGGTVVVSKDLHNPVGHVLKDGRRDLRAQEEFDIYGPHAQTGTPDAELNAPLEHAVRGMEARVGPRTVVPVDEYDETGRQGSQRLFEVHKNIYDITKRVTVDGEVVPNQGFIALLEARRAKGIKTVVVTGKIAEVCVVAAAESIRELFPDLEIALAVDAVSALPVGVAEQIGLASKEQVVAKLANLGVRCASIQDLLPSPSFIADGVLGR